MEKLTQDIAIQAAMPQLEADNTLVEEYKVEKTPTIIVEGTPLTDPFDYEAIASLIETQLGENSDE